jgi:uncharacterized protein YpiB (UPF0302 family)
VQPKSAVFTIPKHFETEEMDSCQPIEVSVHFETNDVVNKQFLLVLKSNKETTTERNSQNSARKSGPAPIKFGIDSIV